MKPEPDHFAFHMSTFQSVKQRPRKQRWSYNHSHSIGTLRNRNDGRKKIRCFGTQTPSTNRSNDDEFECNEFFPEETYLIEDADTKDHIMLTTILLEKFQEQTICIHSHFFGLATIEAGFGGLDQFNASLKGVVADLLKRAADTPRGGPSFSVRSSTSNL